MLNKLDSMTNVLITQLVINGMKLMQARVNARQSTQTTNLHGSNEPNSISMGTTHHDSSSSSSSRLALQKQFLNGDGCLLAGKMGRLRLKQQ
jgi:hypothetical protein